MKGSAADRQILLRLAAEVMEIARLDEQNERRSRWERLNSLEAERPLVWINEIPWHELQGDELRCTCIDPFCRDIESRLRTTLYLWRHMRTDMVVDPVFYTPKIYSDSGFGIAVHAPRGVSEYGRGSDDYVPLIRSEADIDKIKIPQIAADPQATERIAAQTADLIGSVLPVQSRGVTHMWNAPWDVLITWWGVTELFMDMVERPNFVHLGISRMMDALLGRLDQLEALGLLAAGDYNHRVGSGGLGITRELPQPDFDGIHARPIDQWGTSTGQIFSDVSPAMHDEFCLQHELRWLESFGLNAYGCCEPLHHKGEMLKKIPRLRRVSMSRWIDLDRGVETIGDRWIFSYKPNPAVFAETRWDPEPARQELQRMLERTRGCRVEIIMKDITTCRSDSQRLWDWCRMATEMAESVA
ncbi:MAG TPA: hypothetical protein PKN04_15380 [bacterium]|nr:hypothetical protein [bacterium]